MTESGEILSQARGVLTAAAHIDLHEYPVELGYDDGVLIVEGEVDSVRTKKRALEGLAALRGVAGIADRLRVRTDRRVVLLQGLVPSQGERSMAENDAWYVFGVDGVVNHVEVRT